MFLNFEYYLPAKKAQTNRVDPAQTASEEATQIRLLLKKQSDLGFCCLLFC